MFRALTLRPAESIRTSAEETPRPQLETDQRMNKRLVVSLSLTVFGAAVFVSSAQAQRQAAFTFAPQSRTGGAVSAGRRANFARARRMHRYFSGSAFASPFYSDYSDYDSEPEFFEE